MRKYFVILFIQHACLLTGIVAQPFTDIFNVRYFILPARTDFSGADEKVTTTWRTVSVELPLKMKEDYLVFRPNFESYSFGNSEFIKNDLYGVALPVTFLMQLKNKSWKTAITFIPRISSDFENSTANDYQYGGALLAVFEKKENLKYKFGVYYNSEHFGFFMRPLLGIDWRINERLTLFGVLPATMNLEYKTGKHICTGFAFNSFTKSFRLFNDDWFKIEDNHLKIFVDYYVTKNLVLNIEAGHSVFRKYSQGFGKDSGKTETELKFQDGMLVKVGWMWRMRLDKKME